MIKYLKILYEFIINFDNNCFGPSKKRKIDKAAKNPFI